jgi:hypothetical protein
MDTTTPAVPLSTSVKFCKKRIVIINTEFYTDEGCPLNIVCGHRAGQNRVSWGCAPRASLGILSNKWSNHYDLEPPARDRYGHKIHYEQ